MGFVLAYCMKDAAYDYLPIDAALGSSIVGQCGLPLVSAEIVDEGKAVRIVSSDCVEHGNDPGDEDREPEYGDIDDHVEGRESLHWGIVCSAEN